MLASLDTPRTPLVAGAFLTMVTVLTTIATDDGPVLCPFRRCTGGYCPGCGGTRAAKTLASGDLGGAWRLHPWIVLLAAQGALVVAIVLLSRFRPKVRMQLRRAVTPALAANAAFALGLWILRMSTGQIPIPFG